MSHPSDPLDVYLEIGDKRVFAGALNWPGWCRSGRDEASALQNLANYAPRYAGVMRASSLDFELTASESDFNVVERLPGTSTTDFGAPDVAPTIDSMPVSDAELTRLQSILKACWSALDMAAGSAMGVELRKGPRGGGRDLEGVIAHVRGAEEGYLSALGRKPERGATLDQWRQSILDALAASAHGEVAPVGPRGGARWSARYFARRAAWHALDHAWEIEDRSR